MSEDRIPQTVEGLGRAVRAQMSDISAASQLLQRRIGSEQEREYLMMISRGVARTVNALEQWELEERIRENGGLRPSFAPIDLVEWCGALTARADALFRRRELGLAFQTELVCLITEGDRELLDRMMYLLLANAAQGAEAGEEIAVTLAHTQHEVILAVGDAGGEGAGSFWKDCAGGTLEEEALAPGSEAGQRMRLARAIAQAHGGMLIVDHALRGTRVAAVLPVREPAEHERMESPDSWGHGIGAALTALSDVLPASAYAAQYGV